MNILNKADQIINNRAEEKTREYGDIDTEMSKISYLFQIMTGKKLSIDEVYMLLVCLKLARQSNSHKEDNLLDCVAYLGALNNYKNKKDKELDDLIDYLNKTNNKE